MIRPHRSDTTLITSTTGGSAAETPEHVAHRNNALGRPGPVRKLSSPPSTGTLTSATATEANYQTCYSEKINSKFNVKCPELLSQLQPRQ